MLILALDTSDSRGSIALLRDSITLAQHAHTENIDYSAWLLPAVDSLLAESQISLSEIGIFAVSTGPGSFTGLRVGLTTVKAWGEVYGKPIVGVSRLEALAHSSNANSALVAAFYDAYRGQLFGALYRSLYGRRSLIADELVISPPEFLDFVTQNAREDPVSWISLDPQLITTLAAWKQRQQFGDSMSLADHLLAPVIAEVARERATHGEFTDPLHLDANYVRRSDAELYWKGPSRR